MYCRQSFGNFTLDIFKVLTCTLCYQYIVLEDPKFAQDGIALVSLNGSGIQPGQVLYPDIRSNRNISAICSTLDNSKCNSWRKCCNKAMECCDKQMSIINTTVKDGHCPRTWDGFSCFDDTPAGQRVTIQCPSYVKHALAYATAYKDCTDNGTWYQDPVFHREWTNYSTCVHMEDQQTLVYVGLGCSALSILLLIPSVGIFLAFRQLRLQQRIRLHICLFTSFVLTCIVTILWDFLVYYDRLKKAATPEESVMFQNSGGCQFLYILLRYSQTANYFWMFCEGFYLHRLIVHAFEIPKSLLGYYIYGWGVAWLPVVIYAIIRASSDTLDQKCWVDHAGGFEYIIYVPNLISIVVNIFFFVNILRILLTQLQSHPNEPSNYRRAFKATFVLVPLFGIQWILVIYRPSPTSNTLFIYEIAKTVISNTQGAIVSLIFCVFNGEVHTQIKNLLRRYWPSAGNGDNRFNSSMSTNYTSVPTSSVRKSTKSPESEACQSYIPLNHVDESGKLMENGNSRDDVS